MGRRAGRVDANQRTIVMALRKCGWSVQSLASVGCGCPDLLIGKSVRTGPGLTQRINLLLEIKDGSKPPSARRLTPDEAAWHDDWRGQMRVVASLEDIIDLLNQSPK
jgi:hypothetical protein